MKKIKLHSLSALALAGILSFPLKAEDVTNKVEAIYIENAFYESTQDIQLNRVIVDFDISLDPTGKDDFKTFHASEVLIQDKAGQIISKLYYDKKNQTLSIQLNPFEAPLTQIASVNEKKVTLTADWNVNFRVLGDKYQLIFHRLTN